VWIKITSSSAVHRPARIKSFSSVDWVNWQCFEPTGELDGLDGRCMWHTIGWHTIGRTGMPRDDFDVKVVGSQVERFCRFVG